MTNYKKFPETYEGVRLLVERLRGPDGCPWDREQTPDSLKHLLMEECYELLEAIEEDDTGKLVEELGDVLFHVALQIQIATESARFTQEDVFGSLLEKLVRRHPHVFGDATMDDPSEAVPRWDALKRQELAGSDRSILDGVPRAMPALSYAQAVRDRAARMGFEWESYSGVLDKIAEELRELYEATSADEKEHELGDVLFSVVNAAAWLDVEAETALRHANSRFYRRFVTMERLSRERGLSFEELPLDRKEELWQEAKALEEAHQEDAG
jgi:tetrapyrrole methylase family protein/MazG family protein